MKPLKVALIKPPIVGHLLRGTGVYTEEIYSYLKNQTEIEIRLINLKDKTDYFDLVHYPYFDPFFLTLPIIREKPTIVTVHDLIPLKYSKYFPKGIKGAIKWQIQKIALKTAKGIITDSLASKQDIERITGIEGNKIHVIYLGVSPDYRVIRDDKILTAFKKKFNLPEEFLLHVGDVNYNKNIQIIIKSFSTIKKINPQLKLVLVGGGFIHQSRQLQEILNLIKELKLENDILRLSNLDRQELVAIYNLAQIYLQPSLAEGFGLPLLEAMACGCPTVTSNRGSLKEISNEAALLINPENIDDIINAVLTVMKDINIKKELIRKGLENIKKFSWQKTTQKTSQIYQSLIK